MQTQAQKEWAAAVESRIKDSCESDIKMISRLKRPEGPIDVVIDTDTYNEIDDQFALAYLIKSDEKLNLQAMYAAPFFNHHSNSPADGMEKSYNEIIRILTLMGREDLKEKVYRGSEKYLPDEKTFVDSPAANDLVKRAMNYTTENPLYVIAIGAITNVASALIMKPEIAERIVLVWLGGNATSWPDNYEFNLRQDVAGARVVYDANVALVILPCMGVVSAFTTTGPELEHHLRGKNALCDYLIDVTRDEALACGGGETWSRPIWDVTTVGWLLSGDFVMDRLERAPIPEYDNRYAFGPNRKLYRYVYHICRDKLFGDLFKKLAEK